LLHAPVEGPAVFRADQRLRRTHALGHVRHIEPVSVDHVVEVATTFFPETEAMNALSGMDVLEICRPGLSADFDLSRGDLPYVAYGRIDDRFLAPAVRRPLRPSNKRSGKDSVPARSTSTLGIGISIAQQTKKSPGCFTPDSTASSGFSSWLYSISMYCNALSPAGHTRQTVIMRRSDG
jgi:hypothetical protein